VRRTTYKNATLLGVEVSVEGTQPPSAQILRDVALKCEIASENGKSDADPKVNLEQCSFRMVAHGPMLEEADGWELHRSRLDTVAALEKALGDAMRSRLRGD
jgi:hypothetical protein